MSGRTDAGRTIQVIKPAGFVVPARADGLPEDPWGRGLSGFLMPAARA